MPVTLVGPSTLVGPGSLVGPGGLWSEGAPVTGRNAASVALAQRSASSTDLAPFGTSAYLGRRASPATRLGG